MFWRAIAGPATAVLLLAVACGSSTASTAQTAGAAPVAVAAGSGCSTDRQQDLTFTGGLQGHLVCSDGEPVCNFIAVGSGNSGFTVVLNGTAGGKPLLISFAVDGFKGPGSYRSDNTEGGTSITVDGPTHWQGRLGDPVTVSTADQLLLTGKVDSLLSDSALPQVHLSGSWVCDRIKAPAA